MDYDSFSLKGGTQYFSEAQNIVMNAQSASGTGWKSNESGKRNRYWLVDNILHQLFEPLRECNYEYHRLGIDLFTQNPEMARKNILGALEKIKENRQVITEIYPFDLFFNTKYRELTSIFMDAEATQKVNAYSILVEIDPSHITKYDELN
jgi:hypothetical protein